MLKLFLYIIFEFLAIYALNSLNFTFFKKNSYYSARVLYLMTSFALAYLCTNFIYDFITFFKI